MPFNNKPPVNDAEFFSGIGKMHKSLLFRPCTQNNNILHQAAGIISSPLITGLLVGTCALGTAASLLNTLLDIPRAIAGKDTDFMGNITLTLIGSLATLGIPLLIVTFTLSSTIGLFTRPLITLFASEATKKQLIDEAEELLNRDKELHEEPAYPLSYAF